LAGDLSDLKVTVDHFRSRRSAHLIVESGFMKCPYSRRGCAYQQFQQLETQLGGKVRFAWLH
jgi:hypothetical protein